MLSNACILYDRRILCESYWRYCCSIMTYTFEDADDDSVYISFDKDKDTSCIPKFIKRKDLEAKILGSLEIKIDIKKYADSPRPRSGCFELSKDFSTGKISPIVVAVITFTTSFKSYFRYSGHCVFALVQD